MVGSMLKNGHFHVTGLCSVQSILVLQNSNNLEIVLSKFVHHVKLDGVLTPLMIERYCAKIWTNLWVVPICMNKSKGRFCTLDAYVHIAQ